MHIKSLYCVPETPEISYVNSKAKQDRILDTFMEILRLVVRLTGSHSLLINAAVKQAGSDLNIRSYEYYVSY